MDMHNSNTNSDVNNKVVKATDKCTCDSGGYCPDDNLHHPPIACKPCIKLFKKENSCEPLGYMGSDAMYCSDPSVKPVNYAVAPVEEYDDEDDLPF
jgi:hypothetical protein